MKKLFRFSIIMVIFSIIVGCVEAPSEKEKLWKSDNFEIEIIYKAPWSKFNPTLDTKEKLISGFINQKEGTSFIINIEPDISEEILTKEVYAEALINQIKDAHEGNIFIEEEKNVTYLNKRFDKYSFEIQSGNWGTRIQEFFIRRDGKNFIKLIRIYKNEEEFIQEINTFEKNIKFFE